MPWSPRLSTSAARCAVAVAGVGAVVWPMVRRAKHERATEGQKRDFFHEDGTRTIHASHRVSQRLSSCISGEPFGAFLVTRFNVSLPGLERQAGQVLMSKPAWIRPHRRNT